MIRVVHKGNFNKLEQFLAKVGKGKLFRALDKYGRIGVSALSANTPVRTGLTASSWSYYTRVSANSAAIYWTNSNVNNGVNIAVIIQYGHATGTGGYVQGVDYINPAMEPVFQEIADNLWREVTSA